MQSENNFPINVQDDEQSVAQLNYLFKQKIRDLKGELLIREEAMEALKRTLKYTKMTEF